MRINSLLSLLAFGIVVSCGSPAEKPEPAMEEKQDTLVTDKKLDTSKAEMPEVEKQFEVPSFEVEVLLSDKAKEKLESSKETIIVDVVFTGDLVSNSKLERSEDGQFYITTVEKEIRPGEVAEFSNIKIPQSVMKDLKSKDFEVGINVYTGRKVFKTNLLSSLGAFGKISEFKNKRFGIDAALITE